jgi:hypothetical protein
MSTLCSQVAQQSRHKWEPSFAFMPIPMTNASALAAPLPVLLAKDIALFSLWQPMVITAKFLRIFQPARHLLKFVAKKQ